VIFKSKVLLEASKYSIVGGICTLLDMLILFTLGYFFQINYLIASIVSFMVGATLNYFLCTFWIFEVRVIKKRRYEFSYYLLITAFVLLVNTVLMWMFTDVFGLHFMLSKSIAVLFTFILNFTLRKYFLHTLYP
jgi:putative flippase GtrA